MTRRRGASRRPDAPGRAVRTVSSTAAALPGRGGPPGRCRRCRRCRRSAWTTLRVVAVGRTRLGQPPERPVDRAQPERRGEGQGEQRDLRPLPAAHPHDGRRDHGDAQEADAAHGGALDGGGVALRVRVALRDDRPVRTGRDGAVHAEVPRLVGVVGEQDLAESELCGRDRARDDDVAGTESRLHRAGHDRGGLPPDHGGGGGPESEAEERRDHPAGEGRDDDTPPLDGVTDRITRRGTAVHCDGDHDCLHVGARQRAGARRRAGAQQRAGAQNGRSPTRAGTRRRAGARLSCSGPPR